MHICIRGGISVQSDTVLEDASQKRGEAPTYLHDMFMHPMSLEDATDGKAF